jgi:ligand-binding SRPBCC domain-containing protein
MVKGPFSLFVHEHRFDKQDENSCVMHDTITYQWGRSWWGNLISAIGVRLYLMALFRYRHHRTRRWAIDHAKSD